MSCSELRKHSKFLCCDHKLSAHVRCGSERHHARDTALEHWVDPACCGISYGLKIHPGTSFNEGVDYTHEEVGLSR